MPTLLRAGVAVPYALGLVVALAWTAGPQAAQAAGPLQPTENQLAQLRAGAEAASARCLRFVQIEVIEFDECTRGLLGDRKWAPAERLGIDYFTFVGALSAQRSGALGARALAWEAVRRYKALQKKLGVEDEVLCRTVPGDCSARTARAKELMIAPRPAPPTEDEVGRLHRH